jgi:hypothetical protein
MANSTGKFDDLIPLLDAYFAGIAGLCSWGERSLNWSEEFIDEYTPLLKKSFFQKFPVFTPLEALITEKNTPKLFNQFLIYDLMRLTLLDILPDINSEKNINSRNSPELSLAS